jgi:hypothetical protein
MKYLRWSLLFAAVAALWACKAFVAPKTPDAGRNAPADATTDAPLEQTSSPSGAMEAMVDESASVDAETGTPDSHPDAMFDAVAAEKSLDATTDTSVVEAGCDLTGTCKKSDGELCLADTECATGTCGGRCCAAGCTCTQPSPANLLRDPGFDHDISGWTINAGALTRSLSDVERCPYSGSLSTTIPAGAAERSLERCMSNTPLRGDFNFGAKVQVSGGNMASVLACQIIFFSGFNCDADPIAMNETDPASSRDGWQDLTASVPMVSGANSATFRCALLSDPAVETTYYFDMAYVSRAPSLY